MKPLEEIKQRGAIYTILAVMAFYREIKDEVFPPPPPPDKGGKLDGWIENVYVKDQQQIKSAIILNGDKDEKREEKLNEINGKHERLRGSVDAYHR